MAFHTLMISGDRTVLQTDSAVRARLKRYAQRMDTLTVVVTGTGAPRRAADENLLIVYPGGSTKIGNFFALVRASRSVRNVSVVTAQDPYGIGLVGLLASLGRAPLQIQIHGALFDPAFTFESMRHICESILARIVLLFASSVRAVSEKTAEAARRATRAPVFVLPVSVELSQFEKQYERPEEYGDHPVLLAVSRLTHEKNFELMLQALTYLRDAHLYIAGEGPERTHIESRARANALSDRVHFLGFKRPIAPYITNATAVVLTSLYESYCLTLVESVAAGTPVVTVDVGVARELPKGLVSIVPREAEVFAEAAKRVIDSPPPLEVRKEAVRALCATLRTEEETAELFVASLKQVSRS